MTSYLKEEQVEVDAETASWGKLGEEDPLDQSPAIKSWSGMNERADAVVTADSI